MIIPFAEAGHDRHTSCPASVCWCAMHGCGGEDERHVVGRAMLRCCSGGHADCRGAAVKWHATGHGREATSQLQPIRQSRRATAGATTGCAWVPWASARCSAPPQVPRRLAWLASIRISPRSRPAAPAAPSGHWRNPTTYHFTVENGSVTWTGSTKPEVVEAAGTGSGSAASGSGGATAWIANSPTKIEWSKIDRETGQILGGSSWNLQQQVNSEWKTLNVVTDCTQAPCKAEPEGVQYYDADPKPGAFRVERLPVGTYGIVEQPMEGYHPQGHRYTFTVDGTLSIGGVALASGAKQVLDNAIGNWRLCCLMRRCGVEGGDVRGGAVAYWPSCHNRRPNSRCVARWFRYGVVPSLLRVVLSWVRRLLHKKGRDSFRRSGGPQRFSMITHTVSARLMISNTTGRNPAHTMMYFDVRTSTSSILQTAQWTLLLMGSSLAWNGLLWSFVHFVHHERANDHCAHNHLQSIHHGGRHSETQSVRSR